MGRKPDGSQSFEPPVEQDGTPDVFVKTSSSAVVAWQFAAGPVKRKLAPAYANNVAVAQWDAVTSGGNTYIATTGGTTRNDAVIGAVGLGAGIAEGGGSAIVWKGYAGTSYKTSLSVTNGDASNVVLVGDVDVQNAPAPPNYGSMAQLPADPGVSYVRASAGSPVVYVVGLS